MNVTAPVNGLTSVEDSSLLAISAHALVKRFGDVRAVDGIDLDAPRPPLGLSRQQGKKIALTNCWPPSTFRKPDVNK
jgi:hypothetical protein